VSSTCFEHPSVHPQEDVHMQFDGISFMLDSEAWALVSSTSCHRPGCLYVWM